MIKFNSWSYVVRTFVFDWRKDSTPLSELERKHARNRCLTASSRTQMKMRLKMAYFKLAIQSHLFFASDSPKRGHCSLQRVESC